VHTYIYSWARSRRCRPSYSTWGNHLWIDLRKTWDRVWRIASVEPWPELPKFLLPSELRRSQPVKHACKRNRRILQRRFFLVSECHSDFHLHPVFSNPGKCLLPVVRLEVIIQQNTRFIVRHTDSKQWPFRRGWFHHVFAVRDYYYLRVRTIVYFEFTLSPVQKFFNLVCDRIEDWWYSASC